MALTLKNLMHLRCMQGMKLIAGEGGLDRPVCSAGIADYEFARKIHMNCELAFAADSFVISSLLFAMDDEDRILEAVKSLYRQNTSGFAYKNVIFETLPREVAEFCDAHDFPLFVFGQDIYFEDVIFEIMDAVQQDDTRILSSDSIRCMIDGQLTAEQVTETVKGLSLLFKEYSRGIYVSPKKDYPLELERLFHSYYLNKSLRQKAMLCRYEKGLFLLLTSSRNAEEAFVLIEKEVLEGLGLSEENSVVSRSGLHSSRKRLDRCLRESWQTHVAGKAMDCNYGSYDKIGIFRILIPLQKEPALAAYSSEILKPLYGRDELMETMFAYVKHGGDVAATACDCRCHQNTIRYRLMKVRELMGMEDRTDAELYEEFSAAVRIARLLQSEK